MLHRLAHDQPTAAVLACQEPRSAETDRIEALQLARLAGAVLDKSPEDLTALAETNPTLIWEWISAFRRQRVEAEIEARKWAAAAAALSTAVPAALRLAAE